MYCPFCNCDLSPLDNVNPCARCLTWRPVVPVTKEWRGFEKKQATTKPKKSKRIPTLYQADDIENELPDIHDSEGYSISSPDRSDFWQD